MKYEYKWSLLSIKQQIFFASVHGRCWIPKKKLTPTVMSALTTRWTGAPLAPLAGAYPPLISSKVKERWDEDALPVSSEVTNQTVKLIIKR
jgi:hypothetical protein